MAGKRLRKVLLATSRPLGKMGYELFDKDVEVDFIHKVFTRVIAKLPGWMFDTSGIAPYQGDTARQVSFLNDMGYACVLRFMFRKTNENNHGVYVVYNGDTPLGKKLADYVTYGLSREGVYSRGQVEFREDKRIHKFLDGLNMPALSVVLGDVNCPKDGIVLNQSEPIANVMVKAIKYAWKHGRFDSK